MNTLTAGNENLITCINRACYLIKLVDRFRVKLQFVCHRRVRHASEIVRRVRRWRPRHTTDGRPRVRAEAEDDQRVPKGAGVGRTGVGDHVRVLPRVQVPGRAQRAHPVQGGDMPARVPGPLSDGRRRPLAATPATSVRTGGQKGPAERTADRLRAVGGRQHGTAHRPGADVAVCHRGPQQVSSSALSKGTVFTYL